MDPRKNLVLYPADVTDGLSIFPKAAARAFRRGRGFRMVRIAEAHARNLLNFNNVHEKLNGEFKHRTKTANGFNLTPDRDGHAAGGRLPGPDTHSRGK